MKKISKIIIISIVLILFWGVFQISNASSYYSNTSNITASNISTSNLNDNESAIYNSSFSNRYNPEYNAMSTGNYYSNSIYSIDSMSSAQGYYIKSYNVDITVSEDNIYNIKETIVTNFKTAKHGIKRVIPTRNTVERTDGTSSTNKAKITNISVSDEYSKKQNSNSITLTIGNPNYTIIGEHTYVINYTYNIGNDKLQNADEFYLNIIGNQWDTYIGKVTFNVNTGAIDGYEYYNKIKLIGLVFAYNDGDNDKISYWVNEGASYAKGDAGETTKATFNVGTIDNTILSANFTKVRVYTNVYTI